MDWTYFRAPHRGFAGVLIACLFLVAIVAIGIFIALLFRTINAVLTGTPDDVNKLLLGIAGLGGTPFLVWRIYIAAQQASVARENHFTTLFTKAVEQLGATRELTIEKSKNSTDVRAITQTVPNIEVRLGAIYALERISQDSKRDHWPITETLCAYVRTNAGPPRPLTKLIHECLARKSAGLTSGQSATLAKARQRKPSVDVQAALTVIGRRLANRPVADAEPRNRYANNASVFLDLSNANLQGADLRGLNFREGNFEGSSLAFVEADHSQLQHTSFRGADLSGASLLSADLGGADLIDAVAIGAAMAFASLRGAMIHDCDLRGASLEEAYLQKVDLQQSNLAECTINNARLDGAGLMNVDFGTVSMWGAHMKGSTLIHVIFGTTSLKSVNFQGAAFYKCDISEAKELEVEQLHEALADPSTRIPSDFPRPQSWNKADASGNYLSEQLEKKSQYVEVADKLLKESQEREKTFVH